MKLSTDEKASISELLHLIAQAKTLNNNALGLPLYYIPKATHSLQEIQQASTHYFTSNSKGCLPLDDIIDNPLYRAIRKAQIAIVSKGNLAKLLKLFNTITIVAHKDNYIVIGGR